MRSLLLALLLTGTVQAADINGRIKLDAVGYDAGGQSIDAAQGYENSSELAGQLRLGLKQSLRAWTFQGAWQLDARHGSAVARDQAIAAGYPALAASPVDTSYWDWQDTIRDSNSNTSQQRLDRFNLGYSKGSLVLRLGRQALTWGSGMVFHPMDLVNPFQPVATDTAYKRGTDMAYGQWLFPGGSDLQLVSVPHKTRDSGDPDGDKATHALFANIIGETLQWSLLLAKDRADTVLGLGASGPWGSAVWNLEVVPTYLEHGSTRTSVLMNLSHAGTWLGRNITRFAEYYHNGFGESGDGYTLSDLNTPLVLRLERGQQFVSGRDYVSLGANWEWTPLLQLLPTLIYNLQDHSSLLDLQLNRSLTDNTNLKAGLRLATGSTGSEFRGLELAPGSGLYLADNTQVFIRLETYF